MKQSADVKLHTRADDPQWERVVFAEVLIPETPNVYADYWTEDAIREAAYMFMREGFGIDLEHDEIDRSVDKNVYVVETFIVRAGDPDFIKGSWVVAMKIEDDVLWQKVLDAEINGFSYQAMVEFFPAILQMTDDGMRQGVTEPDLSDGHSHKFMVMVDETNRPISGGTDESEGHSHTISTHTVTDEADGHAHRYNLVVGKDGK
jgi:hypothetical protein